jgi:phage terminase large subunit-like protein
MYQLFPDVVWENADKKAPKWSDDGGIILKRRGNPKESTVEAWGVVEGQPTSKHFTHIVFDDLVTIDNVRSPMMIAKTTESLSLADNLGSKNYKRRFIGTRYHFNDTYRELMKTGNVHVRQYPATNDGTPTGTPVLLTRELLEEKRRIQGPYVFSCQMLLNPIADETQSFKKDWLRWHGGIDNLSGNKYILVDPASEKKHTSDYTAIFVIDLGSDGNYKIADIIRDRLNLKERVDVLIRLVRKWKPLKVGYEKYGMQADIEYIKERQRTENYFFDVVPLGGNLSKIDRIKRLIPALSEGKWYLPDSIYKTNYEGKVQDLIDIFINEEYLAFPVPVHDDMLDCMARILDPDLNIVWPLGDNYDDDRRYETRKRSGSVWSV